MIRGKALLESGISMINSKYRNRSKITLRNIISGKINTKPNIVYFIFDTVNKTFKRKP